MNVGFSFALLCFFTCFYLIFMRISVADPFSRRTLIRSASAASPSVATRAARAL